MITLSAKVDILSSDNGVITTTSSADLIKNNISLGFEGIIERRVPMTNPFIIGINKLGDGSTFSSQEKYFMSRQFSNESGDFETPIQFSIYGDKITAFTISFDTVNNRYPKTITVDGQLIQNDDAVFTVSVAEANEHTILINNWNYPNRQLIITGLYIELSINISSKNLIKINRSIFDRGDLALPSWGIISNTGSIEFIDTDYEVKEYSEQLLLVAGTDIEVYLNNNLGNAKEQIGTFSSASWDYNNDNRKVTVSLKDDLEEWQNILLDEYSLKKDQTLYSVYEYLVSKTPRKWQFELDETTKTFLQGIKCAYTYLVSGNLWSQFDKICQIGMLHIYKSNGNKVVVKKFM